MNQAREARKLAQQNGHRTRRVVTGPDADGEVAGGLPEVVQCQPSIRRETVSNLAGAAHGAVDCGQQPLRQGLLCVNCPDRRGLIYRVSDLADRLGFSGALKRLWQVGLPSPHLWYLTPSALERAAAKAGLRPVAAVRMDSVVIKGLWRRIRYVKGQSLGLSLAAYAFALATVPLGRLLPADSSATIFRRA